MRISFSTAGVIDAEIDFGINVDACCVDLVVVTVIAATPTGVDALFVG